MACKSQMKNSFQRKSYKNTFQNLSKPTFLQTNLQNANRMVEYLLTLLF